MDFLKFKQLKSFLESNDYYSNWVGIKNGAFLFSYLAQAAIIAFGYFYVFTLLRNVEDSWNPIIIGGISFAFLAGYEIFKRSITDKWSQDVVRHGVHASGEFIILSIFSLMLYTGSFYVSLHGAMQFADRRTEITEQTFEDISVIKDSISVKYTNQINKLNDDKTIVIQRQIDDNMIEAYNNATQRYSERAWKSDKELVATLQPGYDAALARYSSELDDITEQIKILRTSRDSDISAAEIRLSEKSENKTELSATSSDRFMFMSIIFEMMIIFGVWFKRYFEQRSVNEWNDRLENDPKLARWYKWDRLLDILYRVKFTTLVSGNQIPIAKDFMSACKIEEIIMSEHEIKEFFKVLSTIEIIETRGSRKYIFQNYEGAKNTLGKQFDVDLKKNR